MAKRRVCSYDVMPVPANHIVVADAEGDMLFCGSRCLALWAIQRVTHPHVKPEQTAGVFVVARPGSPRRRFDGLTDLARWSAAELLGQGTARWAMRGELMAPGDKVER